MSSEQADLIRCASCNCEFTWIRDSARRSPVMHAIFQPKTPLFGGPDPGRIDERGKLFCPGCGLLVLRSNYGHEPDGWVWSEFNDKANRGKALPRSYEVLCVSWTSHPGIPRELLVPGGANQLNLAALKNAWAQYANSYPHLCAWAGWPQVKASKSEQGSAKTTQNTNILLEIFKFLVFLAALLFVLGMLGRLVWGWP